uniref:Uncharacterized protein n=1 Tax=Arundo donax TaxID=35708 RepID=A0A0A9DBK2_ARUDO
MVAVGGVRPSGAPVAPRVS